MELDYQREPEAYKGYQIHSDLEIKMNDFPTTMETSKTDGILEHSDTNLHGSFYVGATSILERYEIEDGQIAYDETGGWILVCLKVKISTGIFNPRNSRIQWIMNVVDIEGNKRFPKTFLVDLTEGRFGKKYLDRSLILNRADEILKEGVLTLSCEIFFEWYVTDSQSEISEPVVLKFDCEAGEPLSSYPDCFLFSVSCEGRGEVEALIFDSEDLPRVNNFCTIETIDKSYNLRLDGPHDLGSQLRKASVVFDNCFGLPMNRHENKPIKLPYTDGQTFLNVLYFLQFETLPKLEFDELMKIYKFSDMFLMDALQRICAEDIANSLRNESDFMQLQEIAYRLDDKYLKKLMEDRSHLCENLTERYMK